MILKKYLLTKSTNLKVSIEASGSSQNFTFLFKLAYQSPSLGKAYCLDMSLYHAPSVMVIIIA